MTLPPVDIVMSAYGLGFLAFRPRICLAPEEPVTLVSQLLVEAPGPTRLVYRVGTRRVEAVPVVAHRWAAERNERVVAGLARTV